MNSNQKDEHKQHKVLQLFNTQVGNEKILQPTGTITDLFLCCLFTKRCLWCVKKKKTKKKRDSRFRRRFLSITFLNLRMSDRIWNHSCLTMCYSTNCRYFFKPLWCQTFCELRQNHHVIYKLNWYFLVSASDKRCGSQSYLLKWTLVLVSNLDPVLSLNVPSDLTRGHWASLAPCVLYQQ